MAAFRPLLLFLFIYLVSVAGAEQGEVARPPFVPSFEDINLNRKLAVDGVQIGMSYEQVLRVLGKPHRLNWYQDATQFLYFSSETRHFSPENKVVFVDGKVAYCEGNSLTEGSQSLYESRQPAIRLLERLGTRETFKAGYLWFPHCGVVVTKHHGGLKPQEALGRFGLRDLTIPVKWKRGEILDRIEVWSDSEPLIDGFRGRWWSGQIGLGMSEEDARKVSSREDILFEAGFVRGFYQPKSIRFEEVLGWHRWATRFRLGQSPVSEPSLAIFRHPENWRPDSRADIKVEDGVVKSMRLYAQEDELFRVLTSFDEH